MYIDGGHPIDFIHFWGHLSFSLGNQNICGFHSVLACWFQMAINSGLRPSHPQQGARRLWPLLSNLQWVSLRVTLIWSGEKIIWMFHTFWWIWHNFCSPPSRWCFPQSARLFKTGGNSLDEQACADGSIGNPDISSTEARRWKHVDILYPFAFGKSKPSWKRNKWDTGR